MPESIAGSTQSPAAPTLALPPDLALARREEVLEICYWYRGEGFGTSYSAQSLKSFLPYPEAEIRASLEALVAQGHLVPAGADGAAAAAAPGSFVLTGAGLALAARLFADGFIDFQQAAHGECADGCCDGDDHSRCAHA